MRVTIVISSLNAGGAERVATTVSNYWQKKGWPITIITFESAQAKSNYFLETGIKVVLLDVTSNSRNFFSAAVGNCKRLVKLRKAIIFSKPEVIISFMESTNILSIISVIGLNIPLLISERSNPNKQKIGLIWNLLRKITYPLSTRMIVLNQNTKDFFPKKIQDRIDIIPNPIVMPTISETDQASIILKKPFMVAVGRLSYEKGFDLLIKAFSSFHKQYPEWQLLIIGDGILLVELQALVAKLELQTAIQFLGLLKNPHNIVKQANFFVLSSRYEGFPNVICEALACRVPVISFDCPYGPSDIIKHEVNGLLVPPEDIAALASAMTILATDEEKRTAMSTCAIELVERFSLNKIMYLWEMAITKAIKSCH